MTDRHIAARQVNSEAGKGTFAGVLLAERLLEGLVLLRREMCWNKDDILLLEDRLAALHSNSSGGDDDIIGGGSISGDERGVGRGGGGVGMGEGGNKVSTYVRGEIYRMNQADYAVYRHFDERQTWVEQREAGWEDDVRETREAINAWSQACARQPLVRQRSQSAMLARLRVIQGHSGPRSLQEKRCLLMALDAASVAALLREKWHLVLPPLEAEAMPLPNPELERQ